VLDVLDEEGWGGEETVPPWIVAAMAWPQELESIDALLARADVDFPERMEMGGAAPDLSSPKARTGRAIDELLGSAVPVATAFAGGLVTAELTAAINIVGAVTAIDDLAKQVGGMPGRGLKLVGNGLRKLVSLLDAGGSSGDMARGFLGELQDALSAGLEVLSGKVVSSVVRVGRARRRVDGMLDGWPADRVDAVKLDVDLNQLCTRYAKNMRWGTVIAKRVTRWAPLVIGLTGLVSGKLAVVGANGLGLGYSLFSLGSRLDTNPGFADGVPTIVARNLIPAET